MFETLLRPYKELNPGETIARVREILRSRGLEPHPDFEGHPFPDLYSVSISLDPEHGSFRSNGKGRSSEFSLASAYAEFIERLQNGLYLTASRQMGSALKRDFGFFYWPDERMMTREEFNCLPLEIRSDMIRYRGEAMDQFVNAYFDRLDARGAAGLVAVPFYSTREHRQVYLPLNMLLLCAGSNGMASGNTLEEATFQALCELMERWGAAEVFFKQLTPPDIPHDFLKRFVEEYRIIESIQASGRFRVRVKDLSAGRRIPAIGVLIENADGSRYRLNAGCDTCLQVALSRCLTEVFQGFADEDVIEKSLLETPREQAGMFRDDDEGSRFARFAAFAQFTKDNTGIFPLSLFGSEPSYAFDATVWSQQASYAAEVRALTAYFHGQGFDVYIRNVTYLGFPAVLVYVPEVSALGRKEAGVKLGQTFDIVEWDKVEEKASRLSELSNEELEEVARALGMLPPYLTLTQVMSVKLRDGSPWAKLSVGFVLAQIWCKLGRWKEASTAFEMYLGKAGDLPDYYKVLRRYLMLRSEGRSADEARNELDSAMPGEAVEQVCGDLADPTRVFEHVCLPACPGCTECRLQPECLTKGQLVVARKLYPAMRESMPAQDLSWTAGLQPV